VEQLWAFTYPVTIYTPFNTTTTWYIQGSTVTITAPSVVEQGGARYINPEADICPTLPCTITVNGPINVTITYQKQYLLTVTTPLGTDEYWVNADTPFIVNASPLVNFGNGTRLVNPTVNGSPLPYTVEVDEPMTIVVQYTKQYLVAINAPLNYTEVWVDEGSAITVNERGVIDLNNGTRLVRPEALGHPLPYTVTANGPMNITVTYTKQYFVSFTAYDNETSRWFDAGAEILLTAPEATLPNGTRLVKPEALGLSLPATVVVDGPMNVTVEYAKQYLVVVSSIFGVREYWVDAGSSFAIPLGSEALNGIEFIPYAVIANGARTNGTVAVDKPINVTVAYVAKAFVNFGFPQPYAEATLRCGGEEASAQGLFASSLEPVLYNPTTAECGVTTAVFGWPYVAAIAIAVAAIAVLARRR
jgi:hypothetical protein